MAVRLNTEELFLPRKDDDIPSQHQVPTTTSPLKLNPQVLPPHLHRCFDSHLTRDSLLQTNDKDDDFIAELTRQMAHFMFRDDHQLSFSSVASDKNLEMVPSNHRCLILFQQNKNPSSLFYSFPCSNKSSFFLPLLCPAQVVGFNGFAPINPLAPSGKPRRAFAGIIAAGHAFEQQTVVCMGHPTRASDV